ncbi:MFS transporter [Burkholderia contaminans]|uniref:MFS transporter n=1 Tax=Burkholderia contaminans TaxID=488447 RepID=A0A3N8Q6P9_9BURK|nr:MFS transporter [Burkholderia contaminans]RQT14896.1 MFS transporter [Burkholderia contaminans]
MLKLRNGGLGSMTAGMMIGLMGTYVLPFVVGALTRKPGIPLAGAGWIGGVHIWALSLTACATSLLLKRIPWTGTAVVGGIVTAICWALCAVETRPVLLVSYQIGAGIGAGCLLSIASAAVAGTGDAERIYGRIYTIMSVAFAALLYALPWGQDEFGSDSLFFGIAVTVLALTGAAAGLSRKIQAAGVASSESWRGRGLAVVSLFTSMTFVYAMFGGCYAYSEQAAVTIGLSSTEIGWIFALSTAAATVGALLAVMLGMAWGRTVPFVAATLAAGFANFLILSSHGVAGYGTGMVLYGAVTMFFNSYAYGAAAALDREGRVVSALQGYSLMPYALGAGAIGTLATHTSLANAGLVCMVVNVVGAVIAVPALWVADRRVDQLVRSQNELSAPLRDVKASKS